MPPKHQQNLQSSLLRGTASRATGCRPILGFLPPRRNTEAADGRNFQPYLIEKPPSGSVINVSLSLKPQRIIILSMLEKWHNNSHHLLCQANGGFGSRRVSVQHRTLPPCQDFFGPSSYSVNQGITTKDRAKAPIIHSCAPIFSFARFCASKPRLTNVRNNWVSVLHVAARI